jgi:hypothetical protein
MNYDRYVRPTIWRDFPIIYDNILTFMEEHPDFKGQVQFSGQTFLSLKQAAPKVIEHALQLQKRGQINITGTFYSEPVNTNMDGETNLRCNNLGTAIITKDVGSHDGFYLQERAYHAQLPWILNQAKISWVPVITGDDNTFPFKMRGLDGSVTTCVPISKRQIILDIIKSSPENSLVLFEDDYEIPQSIVGIYQKISDFTKTNKDVDVEWITVKDYLTKFGTKEERFVDGSSKAGSITDGTYSRWTADPLDIIVQEHTIKAMSSFRVANLMNALIQTEFNKSIDQPIAESKIEKIHDPLIWNIEQAALYPEVEPNFLKRNGQVTILSRAEHLLLWAVNSDSKGWFPLYEKRRERINSFDNCTALSNEIINSGLDIISQNLNVKGYDRYFILFNAEPERSNTVTLTTPVPFDVYDYTNNEKLKSITTSVSGEYQLEFSTKLPAYGYKVIGLKKSLQIDESKWMDGSSIENGKLQLSVEGNKVIINNNGTKLEMSLDSFRIKALAEVTDGKGDDKWRNAKPYGGSRISVRKALYPQLRIEKQLDWLVHNSQTFTLMPDRVVAEVDFTFPHPTLIRKIDSNKKFDFDPQGLTLMFKSGNPGKVFYDIPFGTTQHNSKGLSYYCPLTSSIFQYNAGGGFMVSTGTGEQAFYTIPEKGEVGLYMGASTTSGPISDVGMDIISAKEVNHITDWYSEPFHGTYHHKIMIYPYNGTWQEKHAPAISKSFTESSYTREFYSSENKGTWPAEKSLITVTQSGIEISSIEIVDHKLSVRLNDKEGKSSDFDLTIGGKTKKVKMPANGIITIQP